MRNRRRHINQIFSIVLLVVFAIALTPWSSFHHHEEEQTSGCAENGKICTHKFHIGNEIHNCLICSAHFEKNYTTHTITYHTELESTVVIRNFDLVSSSYIALISLALRGPPAA